MTTSPLSAPGAEGTRARAFHLAAWRWHFYAGLYVIPFLAMLAITGMVMMWSATLQGRDGEWIAVSSGPPLPISAQTLAATEATGGSLAAYVAPRAPGLVAMVCVTTPETTQMVAIDPHTAEVMAIRPYRAGLYELMEDIHGTLLLGSTGDRLIEVAASLGILLIGTGLYLWWPRGRLAPDLSRRGRSLWKALHGTVGAWVALFVLVFLLTGLAWTGIWGERYVQAWSSFPAGKFGGVPLSDQTHASLDLRGKDTPWALEQTPLPASDPHAGHGTAPATAHTPTAGAALPLTVDTVAAFARDFGFDARFQMILPVGETGVWTLSRDTMSNDSADPTSDLTVHLDRYSGEVLARIAFDDYAPLAKAMAIGTALHEGDLGWWSVALNTAICSAILFLCVSGTVMWWKRRPPGLRLAAPPLPRDMPIWKGASLLMIALAMAFPMAGLAIVLAAAVDWLILRRFA